MPRVIAVFVSVRVKYWRTVSPSGGRHRAIVLSYLRRFATIR